MRLRNLLLITTALGTLASPALAGPDGAQVVGGSATVQGQGSANVTVNQFSQNAIINWHTFDIGVGQRAQFIQPNSSSVALNRVTGGLGPSQILGSIDANGKVMLVNRDGFVFGAGAVINTGSFLATTSDIRNDDFMAGRYNFHIPGRPDASIVNMGTITAASGGFAALVAPGVRNSGTITATLGSIGLAAGNTFSLDLYGDKLITLGVGDQIAAEVRDVATGETLKSLVSNTGKLSANGGRVELTAAAARRVVDSVINTSGVIEANSVGLRNGRIVLGAATGSTKGEGAPKQTVRVSGKLSASGKQPGTKGGKIVVTGENIEVAGATIDASGHDGGGTVLIGGDWGGGRPDTSLVSNQSARLEHNAVPTATMVNVDAATRIDASATQQGDGGKVVLWADDRMSFAGTILALGGKEFGNGGFIETSGKHVDVSGSINAGTGGAWLLDPTNLVIDAILALTIQTALNAGTDVTQQTATSGPGNGDIIINNGVRIEWNTSATLSLIAFRNIEINDGAFGTPLGNIVNTGAGHLVMRADSTGTGIGTLVMGPTTNATRINWTNSTGTINLYYNPAVFGTQDNFTSGSRIVVTSPGQLTQFMLVNNATNLQAIGDTASTLNQFYALGRDITDFSNTPNFTPIGTVGTPFTGKLEGLGRTISNLNVSPTSASIDSLGLFGVIGANGIVQNFNLANAVVNANPNVGGPGQFMGAVAGQNFGQVINVDVSGTVNGGTMSGVIAGGGVGQNQASGFIQDLIAAVNVSVGDAGFSFNYAGGNTGINKGDILNSKSSGTVNGGSNAFIAGFVAQNDGDVHDGHTTSAVGGMGGPNFSTFVAGFTAFNTGTIGMSSAAGPVSGNDTTNINASTNVAGFVVMNSGTIANSRADGAVNGDALSTTAGFVNTNAGSIMDSITTSNVSGSLNSSAGFVNFNFGDIGHSTAEGNVSGGSAGGFADINGGSIFDSHAHGNVNGAASAAGFVTTNGGSIDGSHASGNVNVAAGGLAGGFFVNNLAGAITHSRSDGAVAGGDQTLVGGFGVFNFSEQAISESSSTSNVTAGNDSMAAGFVTINIGNVLASSSRGSVFAGDRSVAGGFTAINSNVDGFDVGNISQSYSLSPVTVGADSIAAAFAALNAGGIGESYGAGRVIGGPNSILAGLVARNNLAAPDGFDNNPFVTPFNFTTSTGTATNSYWVTDTTGQTNSEGGTPITSAELSSGNLPPGFNPQTWNSSPGHYPCHTGNCNPAPTPGDTVPVNPTPRPDPQPDPQLDPQPGPDIPLLLALLSPQANFAASFANMTLQDPPSTDPVVENQGGSSGGGSGGSGGSGGGGGSGNPGGRPSVNTVPPAGLGPLPSGMPPLNETRFLANEVVMQLGMNMSRAQVEDLARRNGLEIISSEALGLLGRTVYRFRITGGGAVRGLIAAFQRISPNISMQPSYQFDLAEAVAPADTNRQGDSAQYIVSKLQLPQAHAIASGKNVKVAVIDSEIDGQHPDLQGVIAATYDALPSDDRTAHPHGTGMAGAIASHQRLLGVAPGARILAVRAFGVSTSGAQGTSMNIVKGLEWAVKEGAQVINMSFAGPRDPILEQAIKGLKDRGVILIAAAGNAGPKSPPLFPGADPNVIAVSATDVDDKTYKSANRGKQVAIAAPGVDILVPAPEGGYQLTTGTSVAAAHISGVVALLLERNPRLTPAEVRGILAATAKKLPQGRNEIGAGLVDPVQALSKAAPKSAELR